jgi:geranylgeranyl reductase family protein
MSRRFDVAVVGAGPAGSWAALRLARRGARVALFDDSHPREKPCGGGISGRALALVDEVVAGRLSAVPIERATFESGTNGRASVALEAHGITPASALVVTSRRHFDDVLLQSAIAAGASLMAERVRDVALDRSGATVMAAAEYRANHLIGADGAASLVRRRVTTAFGRHQISIATGVFADGVSSHEVLIGITPQPAGYLWSFPRPDHLAIGICAQADEASPAALRTMAAAWMASTGLAAGAPLRPYSWPIPSLTARALDDSMVAGDRWRLVGDAAGLVDPITREGIYFALRSGELAADTLEDGPASVRYREAIQDEIVSELRRAARLKAGFFRPHFLRLLMRGLIRSAAIRQVMADLVAGRQPYRTLRRRLIRTLEWRLACELLLHRAW